MLNLLESIVRDLRDLSIPKLVEFSHYIHTRHPSAESATCHPATAGCMAGDEGVDFESAVREGADRINVDE